MLDGYGSFPELLALSHAKAMMSITSSLMQLPCGAIACSAAPPYPVTMLNEQAARWLAEDPDKVVGRPLAQFAPGAREWLDALGKAAGGASTRLDRVLIAWPDGQSRTQLAFCVPVNADETGRATQVLSVLVDWPEVVVAERGRSGLSYLEETITALPVPLWLYDARGRMRFANAAALRLFGVATFRDLTDLIGVTVAEQILKLRPRITSAATIADVTEQSLSRRVFDKLVTEGASGVWASDRRRQQAEDILQGELAISRALSRRTVRDQIVSLVHPAYESEIIVRASAAPVMNPSRRLVGAVYLTIDVTEEMLNQGQRDAVLAMAGHDIRNPLTPAKILVQQLQRRLGRESGSERVIGELDKILEQLRRVQQIADDLDAVAAIGRGVESATMPSCDLVKISREVAAQQLERQPEIRVTVQTNVDSILGSWGRRHIERVLAMLVASAARRSPAGRAVTIKLRQGRGQVKVQIVDQGSPIPPDRLDALQAVLSRGGAALALTEGIDLDLSIVQTMLGLYRSHLLVSSNQRQGTTFWFALPLPVAPDDEVSE